MDAKTITKTRLPSRHVTEGPGRGTGGTVGLKANPAPERAIAKVAGGPACCFDSGEACFASTAALYGRGRGGKVALTTDGRFSGIAVAGHPDANVTVAELSRRKKDWKPREHGYGAGALWKYAQQAGPAVSGAVTYPGGSHEGVCYADI